MACGKPEAAVTRPISTTPAFSAEAGLMATRIVMMMGTLEM
ncbi:hypothetical protein [Xylella taiwanensis]|nr:hypothetical protein [Xylella taiwanensis]